MTEEFLEERRKRERLEHRTHVLEKLVNETKRCHLLMSGYIMHNRKKIKLYQQEVLQQRVNGIHGAEVCSPLTKCVSHLTRKKDSNNKKGLTLAEKFSSILGGGKARPTRDVAELATSSNLGDPHSPRREDGTLMEPGTQQLRPEVQELLHKVMNLEEVACSFRTQNHDLRRRIRELENENAALRRPPHPAPTYIPQHDNHCEIMPPLVHDTMPPLVHGVAGHTAANEDGDHRKMEVMRHLIERLRSDNAALVAQLPAMTHQTAVDVSGMRDTMVDQENVPPGSGRSVPPRKMRPSQPTLQRRASSTYEGTQGSSPRVSARKRGGSEGLCGAESLIAGVVGLRV